LAPAHELARQLVGQTVGGCYRLTAVLGVGATSFVFKAEQDGEPKTLALKLSRFSVARDQVAMARFDREVQVIDRIRHPGCVRLIGSGESEGMAYIAMELAEGEDLSDVLGRVGRLPVRRALVIAREVCDVLEAAHAVRVVHRDLKPRNIKLAAGPAGRDQVKVLDFGLAKFFRTAPEDTLPATLTRPGETLGTPAYMAPEQVRTGKADERADIYALGVLLYRMVSGKLPITARDPYAMLARLVTDEPLRLRDATIVDPELCDLVMRCLRKDPNERYQTAAELRAALDRYLDKLEESDEETTDVGTVGSALPAVLARAHAPIDIAAASSTLPAGSPFWVPEAASDPSATLEPPAEELPRVHQGLEERTTAARSTRKWSRRPSEAPPSGPSLTSEGPTLPRKAERSPRAVEPAPAAEPVPAAAPAPAAEPPEPGAGAEHRASEVPNPTVKLSASPVGDPVTDVMPVQPVPPELASNAHSAPRRPEDPPSRRAPRRRERDVRLARALASGKRLLLWVAVALATFLATTWIIGR
jgi:serine/threonine-protein kinase